MSSLVVRLGLLSRQPPRGLTAALLVLCALALGCGGNTPPLTTVTDEPIDRPLFRASAVLIGRFDAGDARFEATLRIPDGIGPLYIRTSCSSCHRNGNKGPGAVQKMAIVGADGSTPGDQTPLQWGHSLRPYATAGATTPITAPDVAGVKVTSRLGPSVIGRGYLEAIADAEIERVAAEQAGRSDAIHGHINRVVYASEPNPDSPFQHYQKGEGNLIGRFGFKARIATLDEFAADAAQGDMGLTSPLRPIELPNPDGLTDDGKPGIDLGLDDINHMGDYLRLLEIPRRSSPAGAGTRLFGDVGCAACHVPSLKTRADYPIAELAGLDAPVFSDLLVHDMGDLLADGLVEGSAGSREWRTAPLIGLRFFRSFLHDGRAATVEQAIEQHAGPGSQANDVAARFQALAPADRQALIDYVSSL